MKSDFYVESNMPFKSFSDYAGVMIDLTPDDDRYSECDMFWKSMLGEFYDVSVQYEGFDDELGVDGGVIEFLNGSDSMLSFFTRMLYLCNEYISAVMFLRDYADNGAVDNGKDECVFAKSLMEQCDSVWRTHLMSSPYIHINMDMFNQQDRFDIMHSTKGEVMDILKGRSPICQHYVTFRDRTGVRVVDLTKLSPDTVEGIRSLGHGWHKSFAEWMMNGKKFPDYSKLVAPESNNGGNDKEPVQITDEDLEEFLESESKSEEEGDETAEP